MIDSGEMRDGASGVNVTFRNAIIIMTTNLLSEQSDSAWIVDRTEDERKTLLEGYFRPEFLGRIDRILFYRPLSGIAAQQIVGKRINTLIKRYADMGMSVTISTEAMTLICKKVRTSRYGVRGVDEVIRDTVGVIFASIPDGSEKVNIIAFPNGKMDATVLKGVQ
jgi:ATP-dependent Clp protease ATP-binding subunit ClpB